LISKQFSEVHKNQDGGITPLRFLTITVPQTSRPVVILGGSGFIGTRLAALLTEQHVPFRIGDLRRSKSFPEHWSECDVRRRETLSDLIQGADAIVNLAAAHRDDVRPLSLYRETNVDGATEVCAAARSAGVKKIIFASSVAVYGFQPAPVDENGPFAPFNEYGKTKLEAEGIYRSWAAEDPSRTLVIVRPTVVFGEGNRGDVYNLLRQIAAGRFLIVGHGKNVKSVAYVGNVAAFLSHMLTIGPGTYTFNYVDMPDMDTRTLVEHIRTCLNQRGTNLRLPKTAALACGHLLDAVARLTGRTFPISAIRVRKFCESTQFHADRISQTGFVPPYSLRDGLDKTIQFDFPDKVTKASAAAVGSGSKTVVDH
jgi:nucleoside-diphosphate-sugar epimerase